GIGGLITRHVAQAPEGVLGAAEMLESAGVFPTMAFAHAEFLDLTHEGVEQIEVAVRRWPHRLATGRGGVARALRQAAEGRGQQGMRFLPGKGTGGGAL